LWLFDYVMFCGSQGDAVSRFLTPHVWKIADATVEEMPQINWGAAVLAATYWGLCTGCTKTGIQSILLGCPLLLHLWSYKRLPIGRPLVDRSPYWRWRRSTTQQTSRPWGRCGATARFELRANFVRYLYESNAYRQANSFSYLQISWTEQTRRSYQDFIGQIDNLTDRKVICQPFTNVLVVARAPQGLSSLCFRDRDFWMTKTPLVHDM
jgi:hypothetical protein